MDRRQATNTEQLNHSRSPHESERLESLAPVTSHSILQLQQKQGNQAVGRMMKAGQVRTSADLLALQRTVGNRRVQFILSRRPDRANGKQWRAPEQENPGLKVQTKLTVGARDNIYMHQADRMAEPAMCTPEPSLLARELSHGVQQRVRRRSIQPQSTKQPQLMRQADVQQVPAGLPCVVTMEPRPTSEDLILQFPVSSTSLSSGQQQQIDTLMQSWATNGSTDLVRVDGYASIDGDQRLNWRLSCDRAEAVKQTLITRGMPAGHITTLAHGESTAFSSTTHASNRAATATFRRNLAPLPSLSGAALGRTPATPVTPLPADTIRVWRTLVQKGDTLGALKAVVWAMEQRGEINRFLMGTQAVPSSRLPVCRSPEAILLGSGSGAFTRSCGCFGPSGRRLPNPRIEIHPDLVSRVSIGSGQPLQQRAEVLHSTVLHEFRHVIQDFETCNASGGGSGICTDCNDPAEMDAYLSEIEAGYAPRPIRHAWVRVFTNWDYLSPNQRTLFQARKSASETRINRLFPGVNWHNDAEVRLFRRNCQRLSARTGLTDANVRGNCARSNFPI